MCIAILLKPEAKIEDSTLRKAFSCNRHGAGVAYVRDNKAVIDKGFFDSEEWVKAYHKAKERADADSPILLHARIATLGQVNKDNCHPFPIKNGALMHNGILWSSYSANGRDAEKSDTREFAERMHNNLNYEDVAEDKTALNNAVNYNKIVMLFNDKRYIILNEGQGHWRENNTIWLSNSSFLHAVDKPTITDTYLLPRE